MKLNRFRSLVSLQPDKRNGHKPPIVSQFWGDKSVVLRNSESGPGMIPKQKPEQPAKILPWWLDLHSVDPVTLKTVLPKIKCEIVEVQVEKKPDLDALVAAFNKRRSR